MASTTAVLLQHLSQIVQSCAEIENVLGGEGLDIMADDASLIRRTMAPMKIEAQRLIDWLGEQRLEDSAN